MTPARRSAEKTEELRASLIEHAQRLVAREGAGALTMRALAAEAGCALGLPYKVFASREALIVELIRLEYGDLRAGFDRLVADAGTGTVGGNLARFAELLLGSPAVSLAPEIHSHAELARAANTHAAETGVVAAIEQTVVDYLAAEKRLGRVAAEVDERAFGFVIGGAVHNLLVSGPVYPHPSPRRLKEVLAAVAERLIKH